MSICSLFRVIVGNIFWDFFTICPTFLMEFILIIIMIRVIGNVFWDFFIIKLRVVRMKT